MSIARTIQRVVAVVAGAALLSAALPASAANAVSAPTFETRFPQEPQATTHHNDWGTRRSGGRRHKGNDLMAPKMTQVYAFAHGYVTLITTSRRSGRYIEITHADGWTSYYMHLNNDNPGTDDGKAPWSLTVAPGIEEGTWVRAGQLIGWVGDSGNAEWTGSHTHFELHKDGRAINPYPILHEAWETEYHEYVLEVLDLEFMLDRYEVLI